jgi:hypothetical protein
MLVADALAGASPEVTRRFATHAEGLRSYDRVTQGPDRGTPGQEHVSYLNIWSSDGRLPRSAKAAPHDGHAGGYAGAASLGRR